MMMLLRFGYHLRHYYRYSGTYNDKPIGSYGVYFILAVTLLIMLIAYLGSKERKSNDPK